MSVELLAWANATLEEALQETREHPEFGERWQTRFGDIKSHPHRHDVKLTVDAPPVRAALAALLCALQPTIAASLGEDAELYELAALFSLPGAARQPVHPDTAIVARKGTEEGVTILTAFCALQDVAATMGPTLFLPATHTAEAHAAFFSLDNFDAFNPWDEEDEDGDDEGRAAHDARVTALLGKVPTWRAELSAGDVSLFDSRCLHAGEANTSQRQRVLFYCSFVRAEHASVCGGTLIEALRGKHKIGDWREWLSCDA